MSENSKKIQAAIERLIKDHGVTSILEFDLLAHEILLRNALEKKMGNRLTASVLGIGKSTMNRKMKQYGIEPSS